MNYWRGSAGKLTLLTCLYFAQGIPYGFFEKALPAIMRERGASLPQIGLASLLTLPWAFKWLWAPLIDRYGSSRIGIRKTWIFVFQSMSVALFIVLGMVRDSGDYTYLMWGFLFANLISATQDIAADGLAVSMLNTRERGVGNGLQVAGYRIGMFFAGGFLLMFSENLGWRGMFWMMAAAILVSTLPVVFYRERPPTKRIQGNPWRLLGRLWNRKGMPLWLGVICFYKFGDALASRMLGPYLTDRGMTLGDIGYYLGTIGVIGGLIGALLGGGLIVAMGRYRAIFVFGLMQAAAVFGYYLLSLDMLSESMFSVICFFDHCVGGMATVALFTAMMDLCDPDSGSTDYTLQAGLIVLTSISFAGVAAGFLAKAAGHSGNFLISAVLSLCAALAFGYLYRAQAKNRGAMRCER